MDDRKPGVHFGTVWNEVIEECRKIIDDDEDYELIVRFESYDQMLAHLKTLEGRSQSATHRLLHRVSSHFQRFPAFAAYILLELGGQNLSAAGFLGASVLLVDVSRTPGVAGMFAYGTRRESQAATFGIREHSLPRY